MTEKIVDIFEYKLRTGIISDKEYILQEFEKIQKKGKKRRDKSGEKFAKKKE